MAEGKAEFPESEGCLTTVVLVFSDRWTPLIVDALSQGQSRFCRLQEAVGNVNPRTLSVRLVRLEREGIVTKTIVSNQPPRTEYELTTKGLALLPIIDAMKTWSTRWPRGSEQGE